MLTRVAAVGDLHVGVDSAGAVADELRDIEQHADVLLLAGDLTQAGLPDEAATLAADLRTVRVPVVAVLGNHDVHSDRQDEIRAILTDSGTTVLEGDSVVVPTREGTVGIAGTTGFGGGFADACATAFGEPEMKRFVARTTAMADGLEQALSAIDADVRVALLHYSPIPGTLRGEPPEIHAFLGSYLLGEAVDQGCCDLVVHGHAHRGTEKGATRAGIAVRNVARPVIRCAYAVYGIGARVDHAANHGRDHGGSTMPQRAWSKKRERQYEHIKDGLLDRGESEDTAEEIAARTVNKERARSGEARQRSRSSVDDISSGRRGGLRSHRGPGGRTYDQLYSEARQKNVKGRSKMTKAQLERAVGR